MSGFLCIYSLKKCTMFVHFALKIVKKGTTNIFHIDRVIMQDVLA